MSQATLVDVRNVSPRERHPRIFLEFDNLKVGEKLELVNDHDPKPLLYQFMHERPEQFEWEYQEQGPEVWRVWITRTAMVVESVPKETSIPEKPGWVGSLEPKSEVLMDVRPIIEQGEEPFQAILQTVKGLQDGQHLRLVNSFEPVPLYAVLGKMGFEHHTQCLEGVWTIYFKKSAQVKESLPGKETPQSIKEALFDEMAKRTPRVELDVRGLPPPEPMVRILETLSSVPPGGLLFVHHHREPVLLYDKLKEKGFEAATRRMGEEDYKVLIWKKEG